MSMESQVPVSKEQEIGHTFETGCTEGVYKQWEDIYNIETGNRRPR